MYMSYPCSGHSMDNLNSKIHIKYYAVWTLFKIFKITVLLNGPIYSCCYSEFNFLIPVMFNAQMRCKV